MKHQIDKLTLLHILYLEDSPQDVEMIRELLTDAGYELSMDRTDKKKEFITFLRSSIYDIILCDFQLPGFDAFGALQLAGEICPEVPFICVSGSIGEETAIDLIKQGAVDYVLKDRIIRLPFAIQRAMEEAKDTISRRRTEEELKESEEKYRSVIETTETGFVILDEEGKVLEANAEYVRMSGHKNFNEIASKSVIEWTVKDEWERSSREIIKCFEKGYVRNLVVHYEWPDGQRIPVEINSTVVGKRGKRRVITICRDISERRRIEEKANQLAAIVQSSDDAIIGKTLDGVITSWNKGAEQIYGYTEKEMIGNSVALLIPATNSDELHSILRKIKAGEHIEHYETVRRRKDGREIYMSLTISPIFDTDGNIIAVSTVEHDITKRKQTEERLIKNEALMQTALENLPLIFFIIDPDGKFKLSIGAGLNALGLEQNQVVGQSVFEVYKDFPDVTDAIVKAFTGRPVDFESNVGDTFFINYVVPFSFIQGRIAGLVGVALDVTERRHIAMELKNNEQRFISIFQTVGDSIFLLAVEHENEFRFVSVNEMFLKTIGIPLESIVGKYAHDVIPEPSLSLVLSNYKQAIAKKTIVRWEETTKYPAGTRTGEVSVSPIFDEDDHCTYLVGAVHDITERKLAEEALSESEESYRNLFDNHSAVKMLLDPDTGAILDANKAAAQYYGWTREELKHMTIQQINTLSPEEVKAELEEVRSKGRVHFEFLHRRADGSIRNVEIFSSKIEQKGKTILHSIVHDITERKLTEAALAQEQYLMSMLMDNVPDDIYFKDKDSRFIRINKCQAEKFNLTNPAIAIGKTDFDFFKGEHARHAFEDEQLIIRTGKPIVGIEEKETWHDGRETWVSTTKMPLRDKEGNIIGTFGVSRDISERKQAEEALQTSYAFNELLLQTLPFGMDIVDEHGTILFLSAAMKNLVGYEGAGQTCWSVYKDDKKQCHDCPLRKGIEVGRTDIFETTNALGGRTFQINHVGIMYQDKKAMLEVFLDVTEQRKLQDQFFQAQKIQSIGTLAGGIAHDFNNILGIILMYSSILEKGVTDKEKIIESSSSITKAVERGASLVRQILTFARQTDVAFQPLRIPDLIREVTAMLKETFPKTIEMNIKSEKNIPFINADHSQMHQVLLNLCVNARDAMPNGGKLSISVNAVEQKIVRQRFSAASNERYICIAVSDTGVGIDASILDRIFDPFFTTKEKGKGTGLGLSVLYGIMQTHRGYVHVQSEVGKGTTFILYLPIPNETNLTLKQNETDHSEAVGGTEVILIVEDEDVLRKILRDILESKGYHVYTAADGMEAIGMYQEHMNEIDLVITDMGLPRMTGVEVYKKINKINSQVKVLLASGFLEPNIKSELFKAGAKGFLQKPYKPNEVLKEIRKILDGIE